MAARDDGAIRITLRDVYERVEGVKTNVELLVWSAAVAEKTQTDHEARIRVIEKRVWAIPSAAVLIAAASLIVALLSMHSGAHPSTPTNLGAGPSVTAPAARSPQTSSVNVPASTPATAARASETPVRRRSVPVTTTTTTSPRIVSVPPIEITTPTVTVPTNPIATILGKLGVRP